MALPPLTGAVQATVAEPATAVARTEVGASGTVGPGTTTFERADSGLCPTALIAVTVKVYATPLPSTGRSTPMRWTVVAFPRTCLVAASVEVVPR